MSELSTARYVEYAHSRVNSWSQVERPIFDYLFSRFFKHEFNYLGNPEFPYNRMVATPFGIKIPEYFSALDLGTGTGRVAQRLIDYGVKPQNVMGLDINPNLLADPHFPKGVFKLQSHSVHLHDALKKKFPNSRVGFNLVTSNMLFHLMSYEDYVSTLIQARKHMFPRHSLLMIVIPHPYREMAVKSIGQYHSNSVLNEKAPWGDDIRYHLKTIQDYDRGLAEAGFNCFYGATSGVGLDVHDRYLLSDEAVWMKIKSGDTRVPHAFRYWFIAEPENFGIK